MKIVKKIAMYFGKGFLLFLMMGFGMELGEVVSNGIPSSEYDEVKIEYETSVEALSIQKEELKSIDSNIAGTKLVIEEVKKEIKNEK